MTYFLEKKAFEAEKTSLSHHLLSITLLKSSSQQTKKLYAEAYSNALNAVKLDTLAKYVEAKDAYQKVINVRKQKKKKKLSMFANQIIYKII